MAEVERDVWKHTGIGEPDTHTYLHDRWYAKLVPTLSVEVEGSLAANEFRMRDATFPIRFRQTYGMETSRFQWAVWANWDLRQILFGDNNVQNPLLVIEDQIRTKRRAVLEQVRWHYREAASMAWQLRDPPADPVLEWLWRERLDELGSYLEFFTGKKLVENNEMELPR